MTYYLSFFTLLQLVFPILLTIFLVIFVTRSVKRFEKRADKKLEIEQNQQKQLDELTKKISNIESILNKID